MSEGKSRKQCLACGRDEQIVPLICIDYRGERIWICPQHMPVLIHDPAQLDGLLADARNMQPAEHRD